MFFNKHQSSTLWSYGLRLLIAGAFVTALIWIGRGPVQSTGLLG